MVRQATIIFFAISSLAYGRQKPPIVDKEKITWENIAATIDEGGKVATPGPRGNWRTKPSDKYAALPDPCMRGRKVSVRSRRTGKTIEIHVWDVGPWSTEDHFICEKRRPWAESGKTNLPKYEGRIPARGPAIDLSPASMRALGESTTENAQIDLIIEDET